MLSREDNELMTRVSAGTPMGDTLRQYWMPALLTSDLAEADGAPRRIRLLGENLIAFRDTTGAVGMIADNCPHRGASMFYGRNEECGLRCVYHGWKFDTSGECVDMPNEPPESNFKHKVRIGAYPARERRGVIWVYMGPETTPPDLPKLEWNVVPENQAYVSMRWESCNWAQALEGGIDSSHSSFLHSQLDEKDYTGSSRLGWLYKTYDRHPRFEVVDTSYGVLVGARRDAEVDSYYWRITQFLMPFYSMIPPYGESPTLGGHAWVPIDDENTMTWSVSWHPTRPLGKQEVDQLKSYPGGGIHIGQAGLQPEQAGPYGWRRPTAIAANDYELDMDLQHNVLYSGIPNLAMQDQAMQETMGPIYERWNEHLGTSDTGIIQVRRRWLKAARDMRDNGITPVGVNDPESYYVRSAGVVLSRNAIWVEGAKEHLTAREGVHLASA